MDGKRDIDLLLNEIESGCPSCDRRCLEVIDECLDLIAEKLPDPGITGHRTLKEFLGGANQGMSFEEARTLCWTYLDAFGERKFDFSDPAVCAVRSVIFGLGPVDSLSREDLVDYLGSFLDFVNRVEPHYETEERLLRRYFRAELVRAAADSDGPAGPLGGRGPSEVEALPKSISPGPQRLSSAEEYFLNVLQPNYEAHSRMSTFASALNLATGLYHFHEWLFREYSGVLEEQFGPLGSCGAFWKRLERTDSRFGYVRDIVNASKHVVIGDKHPPSTGIDCIAKVLIVDSDYGGGSYGAGRYGGANVACDDHGQPVSFDTCAKALFDYWKKMLADLTGKIYVESLT